MSAWYGRCSATFVLILSGVIAAPLAFAETMYSFNLPEQLLADSLRAIGQQTEMNILFEPDAVKNARSPALRGQYTVDEAIRLVLAGTKLEAQHTAASNVVIKVKSTRSTVLPATSIDEPGNSGIRLAQSDSGSPQSASAAGPQSTDTSNSMSESSKKEGLSEIVVTGTHIRGTNSKINAVIVIDQGQIERSGYSSTSDLFRSLPQNFQSAATSPDGVLSGLAAAGFNKEFAGGVDLRGLGPSSTLVLLNGHRLAPSAFGQFVDVSQIPLPAIDRVEVLLDGASAIYGSDAVGGVVNIILKQDYQGADTTVRFGGTTGGGRGEVVASQTLGSNWSSGDVVGTLQYQSQGALSATSRTFTSNVPEPTDLFPSDHNYALTLDARQQLFDELEFYGDVLASKRNFTQVYSTRFGSLGNLNLPSSGSTESITVSPNLRYHLSPKWTVELNGLYSDQKFKGSTHEFVPGFSFIDTTIGIDNGYTMKSLDLAFNGPLVSAPAGDIAVAFGASHRTEGLNILLTQVNGNAPAIIRPSNIHRDVNAEFVELHIPIVGAANSIPLVHALELSAAFRHDQYSDFGSTTNPHVAIRWSLVSDLSLSGSYGTSFRAPSTYEEFQAAAGNTIESYQVVGPDGTPVPALVECCGKSLGPERARTLNFGADYKPRWADGLTLTLRHYDIRYQDRIIFPPNPPNLQRATTYGSLLTPLADDAAAQAAVNAAVAAGAQYFDFTDASTGIAGVRYLYDASQQNAALVRQSGFDFTSRYIRSHGRYTLTSQINVAYIDKIDTQLTKDAKAADLANTYGNPARWRARLDSTLSSDAFSISGALNFVGSYADTVAAGSPPIASWTTVDINGTLNAGAFFQSHAWQGVSFSVILLNAFNRDPPFVLNPSATSTLQYDSANANPLGRFVAVAVRKKW